MYERLGIYSEQELQAARRLVREVLRSVRGYRLYEGGSHPNLETMLRELGAQWAQATAGGPLALRLTENTVLLADGVVHRAEGRADSLPTALYDHGIVGLVLRRGVGAEEMRRFVGVLARDPDERTDYASLLWEADLGHVQVLLDVGDVSEGEPAKTPEDFARQVASMGDADDPAAMTEFEREREELTLRAAQRLPDADDPDVGTFTDLERGQLAQMRSEDGFVNAARHALLVVHDLAQGERAPGEAVVVEKAVQSLVASLAGSTDLEGIKEMLRRARGMAASARPLEKRAGELTTATFQEPEVLGRFLRSLDRLDALQAPRLAECLGQLEPASAATVARWLRETRHFGVAAQAMRVYGGAAAAALIPLYAGSDPEGRERIAPALLELGTPEAVGALSQEFDRLPEKTRLELVRVAERSQDAVVRGSVLRAVRDPSVRVRRAAVGALRRGDAPEIARLLPHLLETGAFEQAEKHEVDGFFDMLARIGDRSVARVLAEQCVPKGRLALLRRKLTPLQRLCLKTLRRMHSPEVRAVVADLKPKLPREGRDILEDPLAGLE
jgi:hypothetical protein